LYKYPSKNIFICKNDTSILDSNIYKRDKEFNRKVFWLNNPFKCYTEINNAHKCQNISIVCTVFLNCKNSYFPSFFKKNFEH